MGVLKRIAPKKFLCKYPLKKGALVAAVTLLVNYFINRIIEVPAAAGDFETVAINTLSKLTNPSLRYTIFHAH